jgi:hypothetical protein
MIKHRPLYNFVKHLAGHYHSHKVRFISYFFIAIIFIVGIIPLLCELAKPQKILNVVSAKTEIFEMLPENPNASSIPIVAARLRVLNNSVPDAGDKGHCVRNAIFRPASGAREVLARSGNLLVVSISGRKGASTGILINEAESTTYHDKVQIAFDYQDKECQSESIIRFPVAGQAVIGSEYSAPTSAEETSLTLTEGSVDIYGRAHAFFIFSLFFNDTLFPATKIALPAGLRRHGSLVGICRRQVL